MFRHSRTRAVPVILLLVLLVTALPVAADEIGFEEVFPVETGARLELMSRSGDITVRVWDRGEARVRAEHGPAVQVEARERRGDVLVGSFGKDPAAPVDYEIDLPVWMGIRIRGQFADVEIDGTEAEVDVEVVDGDVYVRGGRGEVFLRSVHGSVEVQGAEGLIDLESTNEDVTVIDGRGEIRIQSINGDLRLENVAGEQVEGVTTNGDIRYDGILQSDGDYYFTSHSGDIEITLSQDADLTVRVTTYRGDFRTDLGVPPVEELGGKRYEMVLGSGTGRLRAESFEGDVELRSPKHVRTKQGR